MLLASSGVLARPLDDQLVLLDTATERYLGLNASAARMWTLATTLPRRLQVLDQLGRDFPDVAADVLARDFDAFVEQVCDAGLAALGD